jgi:serine/threonine-protein kinase
MAIVGDGAGYGGGPDEAYRRGMQVLERLGRGKGHGPEPDGRPSVRGYVIPPGPLLGRGRFGRVFRARDLSTPREVAIKVLNTDVADDDIQRARMESEAVALALLQQTDAADRVVPILDSGQTAEGRHYLVTQYIDGGSLYDRLLDNPLQTPQPLEPRQVATWVEQIARALHVAH